MALNGMADSALKELDKASELAKRSGYDQTPFLIVIARLRAIANLTEPARSARMPEARELFSGALRRAEDEKVYGVETELLIQYGQIAFDSGDTEEAERSFSRAASVANSAQLLGLEAEALLSLSRLYLQNGKAALAAQTIGRGMHEVMGAEEGYDLPLFVAAQADAAAALGHLKTADALYDRATTLLEGLLINAPSSQVKSSMISAFSRIYVAHFRLTWDQLHDGPKAFEIIESARGRVLLDSIRYAQHSQSAAGASPAEARIASLQRSLLHQRFSNSQTKRILDELDDAYDQLASSARVQERAEVTMLRRPPLPLSALIRVLKPNQVFVEYVLDRGSSYALEVSVRGMRVHRLPAKSQIAGLTGSYLASVKTSGNTRDKSQALYSELLSPVFTQKWNSLIVVPDGSLHLIPFEALQDETGAYLVERVSVSVAPSATVLAALEREPETAALREFLGVAFSAATSAAATSSGTRGITDLRGADIKPLRFGREEVDQANSALGGHGVVLDGAHASEADLKAQPLSEFKVIHLAAHAVDDESAPDRAPECYLPVHLRKMDSGRRVRFVKHISTPRRLSFLLVKQVRAAWKARKES